MEFQSGFGVAQMDAPNTHKMDAPSDVTSWTVIPTTRNAVNEDGRGMNLRDEWWHIPTFVVEEIERLALVETDTDRDTPIPTEPVDDGPSSPVVPDPKSDPVPETDPASETAAGTEP